MKKFYKQFCVAIVLLVSVVFFSGCASATYSRVVFDDGTIKDVYEITLDQDQAQSSDCSTLMTYLYQDLGQYSIDCREAYKQAIIEYYADDEDTRTALIGGFTSDVSFDETSLSIRYVRTFASTDVLSAYVDALNGTLGQEDEESGSGYELEPGLFISEYTAYVNNWFSNFKASDLYKNNVDRYTAFGHDLSDLKLAQEYMCPTGKLNTNSDETYHSDGYTLYRWNLNDDTVLKYYYKTPNMVTWYVLAVVLSVVATLCVVVYVLIKKTKTQCSKSKV